MVGLDDMAWATQRPQIGESKSQLRCLLDWSDVIDVFRKSGATFQQTLLT